MSDFSKFIDMTTTSGTILLNAGLPWTNPLKIQIGSDEHIIDTTINRGLMMLLNNDFYLDAKSSVLSKELSSVIDNVDTLKDILYNHVNDDSIHGQKQLTTMVQNITNAVVSDAVSNLNYNDDKLLCDTIKYLSIGWSAAKINSVIKNTPHNLNTYTLIFVFVVPEGYTAVDDEYVCNIENECIEFSHFYNGTLFVQGDYLHAKDTATEFQIPKKTEAQINDPVGQDGVNLKHYIANLQEELLNPEEINSIIDSEDETSLQKDKLKKIKIVGTAVNDNYSVMSFKNISARTYVKNLSFKSALKNDDTIKDALVIEDFATKSDLPTNERLLLFYPFENDFKPTVGYAIKNQINSSENRKALPLLSGINELVLSSISLIDSNVFGTSGLIDYFNDQIATLNKPNVNENKNYLLTSGQINDIRTKVEALTGEFEALRTNIMTTNESEYFVDGEFKNDDFTTKLMAYQKSMIDYKSAVSTVFDYSGIQSFLYDRPDLAEVFNYTSGSFDSYKDVYLTSSIALIDKALVSSNIVFGNMTNWLEEDLTNAFTLTSGSNSQLKFTVSAFTDGNDAYVNFNNDTNECKSLEFGPSGTNMLELTRDDRQMNRFLFESLFENVNFQGITEKAGNSSDLNSFNSSSKGSTICFWVRKSQTSNNDDVGFLEFNMKNAAASATFTLTLNDTSDRAVISGDASITSVALDHVDNGSNGISDIITDNEWQMVQYFIDNSDADNLLLKRKIYYFEFNDLTQTAEIKSKESEIATIERKKIPKSNEYDYSMVVGLTKTPPESVGNPIVIKSMKGYIRNLSFFVGSLTPIESEMMFLRGIRDFYDLPYESTNASLSELIRTGQFYLGLLSVYSVDNINILNCVMKYSGKSFIVK